MWKTLRSMWDESGRDEPLERGPGIVIAAASAYPVIVLIIGAGAAVGWW